LTKKLREQTSAIGVLTIYLSFACLGQEKMNAAELPSDAACFEERYAVQSASCTNYHPSLEI